MRHDSVIPSFLLERATSDCATISRHLVFERLRSVVLWPNGAESLSLFLSLVLLQQSLSAVKIVVRRKRGGSDKQSGDEQEGLARVNHTLLHRRQKTLSTCCPSPLCFIILRNREAGAEWDIRDTFRFDFQSILFNSNSFFPKGKFIRLINYFELTNNFSWIVLSRKEKMKNCIDEEEGGAKEGYEPSESFLDLTVAKRY